MKRTAITRRTFIAGAVGTGVAASSLASMPVPSSRMPLRPLGNTGWESSVLGFGGFPISHVDEREAVEILHRAIDLGVNYIDTAGTYGDSEAKIGAVMRSRRRDVFLATKVLKRTKAEAEEELTGSFERLHVDVIDSVQLHAINTMEDLDAVTRSGGALEALVEAREAGSIRFIGIAGHRRPDVIVAALERFDFDTVLIPSSLADVQLHDFEPDLFPLCRERGVGVVLMKILAMGRLARRVRPEEALSWAFNRAGPATCILGMRSLQELETAVKTAIDPRPLGEVEMARLLVAAQPLANTDVLWYKR
jgi:uncharacterized protein